jgi:hypothetical protein
MSKYLSKTNQVIPKEIKYGAAQAKVLTSDQAMISLRLT